MICNFGKFAHMKATLFCFLYIIIICSCINHQKVLRFNIKKLLNNFNVDHFNADSSDCINIYYTEIYFGNKSF